MIYYGSGYTTTDNLSVDFYDGLDLSGATGLPSPPRPTPRRLSTASSIW